MRYLRSIDAKIYIINVVPWGALGYIHTLEPFRIFWLLKLHRTKTFLKAFQYQNYNSFFRNLLNYRMTLRNNFFGK